MFWKYNNTGSSQIDSLLTKEDVTLQEVMDSEDIISECRVQNKNLIDFLLKPDIIEELVNLTTKEPSSDIEERSRFKYPNIASELLTCDVPLINERLASDEGLLEKLYVFLEGEIPLNPLLASYFSKIMGALIAKKTEQNWLSYQFTCLQVLDFLKARGSFLPLLLKHMGTSAIMDLMLKLMTQVEGVEMKQNILNWLDSQQIVQKLIELLNPTVDKERHDNVANLLCDFIKTARENLRNSTERADPDPLLNTLESPETVNLLLNQIFEKEKCDSSIVGGIQVLLSLLYIYQSSLPNIYSSNINDEAMDLEQKQKVIATTTEAICARLKDFHNLLLEPPKQSSVLTTAGLLDPPVGSTRLSVVKLFSSIIQSTSSQAKPLEELVKLGTFQVLLDLFFRYSWNNFLHTQVENCLVTALNSCSVVEFTEQTTNALCTHLIVDCKLVDRLLTAWNENEEQQKEGKQIRQGYMGHVISIVSTIVELCSTTHLGKWLCTYEEQWKLLEEFKEGPLAEAKKVQDSLLGGAHPLNSSIEVNDFNNIPYAQTTALQQQVYSTYQMQNLTSQYIDGYSGFSDDAFNDGEETLQTIDNPSDVNFDLSENDLMQRDEIFKQMCAQNINTLFDAEDQIFDDKEHTFQTVIEKQSDKNEVYSSDSEDESPSGDETMDVDPWSSPKPADTAAMIAGDPWNLPQAGSTEMGGSGWADFSQAAFEANFPAFDSDKQDTESAGNKEENTETPMDQPAKDKPLTTSKAPPQPPDTSSLVPQIEVTRHNPDPSLPQTTTQIKDVAAADNVATAENVPTRQDGVELSNEKTSKSAAGDQKIEGEKKEIASVAQPSIAVEGDACKQPQPNQEPSSTTTADQKKV